QRSVFLRVELEIGVLDQDDVAGGIPQAEADRGALADVDLKFVDADPGIAAPSAARHRLARPVAAAVVGDDDFLVDTRQIDGAHALDDLADRLLFVVDGDDDGELHRYN